MAIFPEYAVPSPCQASLALVVSGGKHEGRWFGANRRICPTISSLPRSLFFADDVIFPPSNCAIRGVTKLQGKLKMQPGDTEITEAERRGRKPRDHSLGPNSHLPREFSALVSEVSAPPGCIFATRVPTRCLRPEDWAHPQSVPGGPGLKVESVVSYSLSAHARLLVK